MRLILLSILFGLSCFAGSARAEWLQASSDHFVVYANDGERDLRRYSERLERYHSAMALITQRNTEKPSPSNRVTVYLVRSERAVQDLYGKGSKYIGGFYIPRAGGSLAIVPQIQSSIQDPFSMVALLHEYAHHFIISASALAMPRWVSEGSAEFFSSSTFQTDGGILLGRAAQHRAAELFLANDVKAEELLDPAVYNKKSRRNYDAFYGKSWLLFHYLTFEKARRGQFKAYLELLQKGSGQREAAQAAFGDFGVLDKDLDRYLAQRKIMALNLPANMLQVGPVEVRRLSVGEAAMMSVVVHSRRGVDDEEAKAVLREARDIAKHFPNDAAVLSALAESEYDAGNDKEAIAAADAALAIDPAQVNAYLQKGYALFRMAPDEKNSDQAYKRARQPFIALNRRENDHPIPLIYFYRSFVDQGLPPSQLAIDGLDRAVAVAPFDLGLRMTLATALIQGGRQADAKRILQPVAFNPHGGDLADAARKLLARLDSDPQWKGADMAAVLGTAGAAGSEPKACSAGAC